MVHAYQEAGNYTDEGRKLIYDIISCCYLVFVKYTLMWIPVFVLLLLHVPVLLFLLVLVILLLQVHIL